MTESLEQPDHGAARRTPDVVSRMAGRVRRWQAEDDGRAVFLNCYMLMTRNMFAALHNKEFADCLWVEDLLHRFAGYYFDALAAYDRDLPATPAVWRMAHNAARRPETLALQRMLLGVNAHINYDLVLTLDEILAPEWADLDADQWARRYADHCRVNDVIGRSIDIVQDDVLAPRAPYMRRVDDLLGPVDEWMVFRLLRSWRERVWRDALALLAAETPQAREALRRQVEAQAQARARAILLQEYVGRLQDMG